MKIDIFKTSLLSFATIALLLNGCGETQEAPASTQTTPSSLKGTYTPNTEITTQTSVELEAITKEKMDLAIAYDKKLVDCYTSGAESCSDIISEMVEAEMEIEMKEMMVQEELNMEKMMQTPSTSNMPTDTYSYTTPTTQNYDYSNPTQGVTNAF